MKDAGNAAGRRVGVWDPVVRIGHWLLVVSIAAAWLTRHGFGLWHEVIGYLSLAVIGMRLVWGFAGSAHARFGNFIRGPRATMAYASRTLRGEEPRYAGHNPLGAWMIVLLMTMVVLVGASGWLYTTDRYWGIEWVETTHRILSNTLFALIAVHIAGVIYASVRHRENLIGAMLHGRKREAGPNDVVH